MPWYTEVQKGGSDSGGAEWFKSGLAEFVHGEISFLEEQSPRHRLMELEMAIQAQAENPVILP